MKRRMKRARIGDEAGDDELAGAGGHGAPDLGDAVVRRARDGEAVDEEVGQAPAIGESRVAGAGDLVVVGVVLALEAPDPLVQIRQARPCPRA